MKKRIESFLLGVLMLAGLLRPRKESRPYRDEHENAGIG